MEIIAYTTLGCFYCDQLKELFRRANLKYQMVIIESEDDRENFRKDFPRAQGYPYVMINGEHVGGLVETAKLLLEKGLVSSSQK